RDSARPARPRRRPGPAAPVGALLPHRLGDRFRRIPGARGGAADGLLSHRVRGLLRPRRRSHPARRGQRAVLRPRRGPAAENRHLGDGRRHPSRDGLPVTRRDRGWSPTLISCDDLHGPAVAAPASAYPDTSGPDWYRDAKLGIFVHWGLYSVPAWADVLDRSD